MKTFAIGIIGSCLLATGAVKAGGTESSDKDLRVQRFEDIPYVSGGVGIEERDRLRSLAADDNLALSFSLENGQYLGGAEVSIKDNKGKELLEAASDGPLFFAKLPPGRYIVEATAMGRTITHTVVVPSNNQAQLHFAWKQNDHV